MTRQASFEIYAVGSTEARELAREKAREQGLRIRTLSRVDQLEPHRRDNRKERLLWRVTFAVAS